MPVTEHRRPDHPIDPLCLNRWSPRAFTGEEIPDAVLKQRFEALTTFVSEGVFAAS